MPRMRRPWSVVSCPATVSVLRRIERSLQASAYVNIRQHTSVSICQHTSAYVRIRQHTSAYVTHPAAVGGIRCRVAVDSPAPHASVFALLY